ncbi:PhaM family polyhydroxyalkanoate granule multifunctional regulatory protein [Noviherbaspirillum aerium]|uniref:PhaM family polyhydroxyalkanoate granule multifunctional regulatory protein n=1 Tax=Noviherbaspirillum aerium TaxID=2588497 RepID=UPI00124D947C|nr:PhaM family polyhydroxyalkanoate granule multifunctional regulatory protein [Noviherbaspirillum aerium]
MSKPATPNFPGMSAMTDSLDFVKTLWGNMGIPGMNMPAMNAAGMNMPGMGIPGMVMPTLSVEEINKKIADLKAVENWLTLNMNMLRGTIQALEVQAATISTLQTMSESFAASMQPAAKAAPAASGQEHGNGNGKSASPFTYGNGSGNGAAAQAAGASSNDAKTQGAPEPTSKDQSDAASLTAPLMNAAIWWNMLQDQFKQAVNNAMTEMPKPAESTPKDDAKAASRPKAEGKEDSAAKPAPAAARKPKAAK